MLIFIVFISIYLLISFTVYEKVNEHINYEINEYSKKIEIVNNNVRLIDKNEWEEREHNEVSVDPVFLEITNSNGQIIEKSENLKSANLYFSRKLLKSKITDIKLSGQLIRQIQFPLYNKTKIGGYLLVAVSLEEATSVLDNLRTILLISFPIVLMLLFFVARLIAGRSIKPINAIINTAEAITRENLKSRIILPNNKDELYTLSVTINSLLDRIENTIEREKQFTSDASHELRTPLAVIKGTLEVLIRKPRSTDEYQQKITFCIYEVDRINNLVDQLLLLARFENQKLAVKIEKINLNQIVNEILNRFALKIKNKNINIIKDLEDDYYVESDLYLLSIVLNNLISNALKYSNDNSSITISFKNLDSKTFFEISDTGIGISENEIGKVFHSFFRTTNSTNIPEIKGTGLGLSIAKRICDILNISIEISSQERIGTQVKLSVN
ncbi:signal transduction histidine kinase [Flavobacterium sp. CG_9.10]|uniref:sensor histidine kinase n=1 Tax=Flavobacterium sp. CG_9.10 TaxID=2787729 RepID=UPI001A1A6B1D|nr:HAMP domain-containing sensor histidine kinase [Flavobacterium sp. CG_9.10]MBG6111390.1 signal transduction histidine kinase [Flavobacterium sp. CG_9.10]